MKEKEIVYGILIMIQLVTILLRYAQKTENIILVKLLVKK